MLISITGSTGTGKTSVGKLLAKRLGYKFISLNKLAERKNLYCGYDKKRKCRIVDIGRVGKELEKTKNIYKNIVIESHYSHYIQSDLSVVLRCNPKELEKRLQERRWKKDKIKENIEAEIMEICLSDARGYSKRVIVIDTTGKQPEVCVKEIVNKLE